MDETVLRCSVLYYFIWLLYYVTMPLMWNGITWDSEHVLFRCKNCKMEQKIVIFSENASILIYTNRDTVLKFSVVSCAFSLSSSLIWKELRLQIYIYLIIFNLNWYDNRDPDCNDNLNWFLRSLLCYVLCFILFIFISHVCIIPAHTKVYWNSWLYLHMVENSVPERE